MSADIEATSEADDLAPDYDPEQPPTPEVLELAQRLADLEGVSRVAAASVAEHVDGDPTVLERVTVEQLRDVKRIGVRTAERIYEAYSGPPDPTVAKFRDAAKTRTEQRREFVSVKVRRDVRELLIAVNHATGVGRQHVLTQIVADWADRNPAYLAEIGVDDWHAVTETSE
jgi:hypothetical protein